MAMVVRNNLMAYNANRQLGMNTSQVSKNIEKLSSGFKINRAADDAAGLAVSEKMKAQIKGLEQASANSQDGISLVQTAEGALTEVHDMLNRMTELATKSANGTIDNDVDRAAIQNEVNKLNEEIDRISSSTNFNGIKLLDGSLGSSGGSSSSKTAELGMTDQAKLDGALVLNAATKGTSVMASAVAAVATGKTNSYTYTYRDKSGAVKDIKIDITAPAAAGKFSYSINGGEVKTAAAGQAAASSTAAEVGTALVEILGSDSGFSEAFDITNAAGTLTFTAKEAGDVKQEVLRMTSTADVGGANTAASVAATPTKGTDAFSSLDVASLKFYGPAAAGNATTNTKDAIFTVDGKKFAFAQNGSKAAAQTALGDDVTIIEANAAGTNALDDADAAEMIKAINIKLGRNAAAVDGTTDTQINFKAIEGATGGSNKGLTLQIGETGEDFNQVTVSVDNMSASGIGTKDLDVSTQDSAKAAIETIKTGINKVSTNRGELGALQNRLEHTINNLDVSAENMTSANSRIRDTDMAKQMMEYTKMNVLQQSAQAMLATANQAPQSILQLLQ